MGLFDKWLNTTIITLTSLSVAFFLSIFDRFSILSRLFLSMFTYNLTDSALFADFRHNSNRPDNFHLGMYQTGNHICANKIYYASALASISIYLRPQHVSRG